MLRYAHNTHFIQMRVFFGCTAAELNKYQKYYLAIRQFLIDEGHVLTRDWIPDAIKRMHKLTPPEEYDPKKIAAAFQHAMNESDVIIVEDTVSNFSTGYEITFALQRNKPVLVLWLKDKHHLFDRTLLHGIESEYLQISQYDLSNYRELIRRFLNKFDSNLEKHRFNLVVDDIERRYLDWGRFAKHKSRTDLVRSALRKQIENDAEYQQYLLGKKN